MRIKKEFISHALLLVFIILGFIFLRKHVHELKNILQVNLWYVVIIFLLKILATLIRGLRLKTLTKVYGLNLRFKEWFGLTIMTTFGNYLSPFRAGGTAMAVYLKKKYNFPYTYSVSLTGVLYLVQFFLLGLLGLFLIFFTSFPEKFKYGAILFFAIIFSISIFLLFIIPLPITINVKILKHLANGFSEFRRVRNFPFMIRMIFLDASRITVVALSIYFAFKAYNFNASFYNCVILTIFEALSLIISLTPMGLGVYESIVIITSKLMGANILTGTFVAALDRAISILAIFVLVPIFSYLLFKKRKPQKFI